MKLFSIAPLLPVLFANAAEAAGIRRTKKEGKRSKAGKSQLRVMTQNQYIGADIAPILRSGSPEEYAAAVFEVLSDLISTNFRERAVSLAASIIEKDAHLVGLQEVYSWSCVPNPDFPWPFPGTPCDQFSDGMNDQLEVTMAELEKQDGNYTVAAVVYNSVGLEQAPVFLDDSGIPAAAIVNFDRGVILANGDTVQDLSVTPFNDICSKPSLDGCNFDAELEFSVFGNTFAIQRGFVGVDATINDSLYRFVSVHLEISRPDPENDASGLFQALQATELLNYLNAVPMEEDRELILVGDLNDDPRRPTIEVPGDILGLPGTLTVKTPYMQIVDGTDLIGQEIFEDGFVDMWTLRKRKKEEGLTWGHDKDLRNEEQEFTLRLDYIFTKNTPSYAKTGLIFDEPEDKTESGLWPSDHATVTGRVKFEGHSKSGKQAKIGEVFGSKSEKSWIEMFEEDYEE